MKFTAPLILKRAPPATKTGFFSGFGSTWSVDRHGHRIARGAFQKTLAAFNGGKQRIALLHAHDIEQQIGTITGASETSDGLAVDGMILLGTPVADRDYDMLMNNAAGLSIGFTADESDISEDANGVTVFHSIDLAEISVVSVPSNRESIVHTVKSLTECSTSDLSRMLRDGALPALPRRLAEKVAAATAGVIKNAKIDEPAPADRAALKAAIAATLKSLKTL